MNKKWIWALFLLAGLAEVLSLAWIRGEYLTVREEGAEYITPVSVDFSKNFYETHYISLHIPLRKAMWQGDTPPEKGEEVYLAIRSDSDRRLEILHAQMDEPSGDYIRVRARGMDGDILHFDFPVERLYLPAEDIRRISVSELAERMQVRDPDTGKVVTRLKNEITARLRIRGGQLVIEDLLVNGSPVQAAFTTVSHV